MPRLRPVGRGDDRPRAGRPGRRHLGADGEKRTPAGPAGLAEHHRPRVLLLSWHAEDGAISAGGYRRTVEMVRRFEAWGEFTVVDTQPAMFSVAPPSLVVPYRLPELGWLVRIDRRLARLAQWPWATLSMIRLGRRACRAGVDVIYVPSSELLPCVLAGVALSRVYRRRLVLCNMNVGAHALGRLVVALHNLANEVVTLSPGLADALARRGLRRRPHVIGCGSPVQEEPQAGERPPKEWDAVFIGRHTKAKGILDLLDIWELVRQRHPHGRLVLVGSCSEEMARLIDARCEGRPLLRGAVARLGILSEPEKNTTLAASRVLLFPSRFEGWGFVPQEALVRSVPVVCWDLPAYEASLPRHPSVVRIATGDAERFASAALDLLALDDDTRSDLAAAAPMTMPSWDDVAEQEWSVLCAPGDRL